MPLHPGPPRQNVLDRIIEHVTQRQHACDVRRRNDNRIRRFGRTRVRGETFLVQPILVPFILDRLGFVGFWDFGHDAWRAYLSRRNSIESTSAPRLASMMLSLTPT